MPFRDFKAALKPRFLRLWLELLAGHAALVVVLAGVIWSQSALPILGSAALAGIGSVLIGFAFAYVQLFFHEAAHYNIAPNRKLNDRLADIFIGVFIGQSIAQYRAIHFDHHRFLGTTRDTERSYFDPLTWRFILESLTGIRVLKVVTLRQRASKAAWEGPPADLRKRSMWNFHLVGGLMLHGALFCAVLWFGQWAAAGAWMAGVVVFFPFFGAVRQMLEHRSETARPEVNYAEIDHGATNRLFGVGPVASTLGGAGFNRHLLHHWEPQISYTRFAELEQFLLDSSAAEALRRHQTTYRATFRALLRANEPHVAQ